MTSKSNSLLNRAQGCLAGQLVGDALGSLVEFQPPERIRMDYPGGIRDMKDGGTWDTLAGQPTDDSEMALALARVLVRNGAYTVRSARAAYSAWLASEPFDVGATVSGALRGSPNPDSQANGALMRISPLGIFGVRHTEAEVMAWAMGDAAITHGHPVCQQINALFAATVRKAILEETFPGVLFDYILELADSMGMHRSVVEVTRLSISEPPKDYTRNEGWVLTAWQNAVWQLAREANPEQGIMDTVARGGDTDTNAAIAGALLGAVFGVGAISSRWRKVLAKCRPSPDNPRCRHPRPSDYWPGDYMTLAEKLLG